MIDNTLEQKLPAKQRKRNDDENSVDSNDKENIGLDTNAPSMIADLPIVNASDSETSRKEYPAIDSENSKQSLLFSGSYYEIISKDAAGIKARCMECGKIRTGTKQTTSNFITHLKVRKFVFISILFIAFHFFIASIDYNKLFFVFSYMVKCINNI